MNKVKRILAIVLAMAMVVAMNIASFAATNDALTGTYISNIEISGFDNGAVVKAYCAVSLNSGSAEDSWNIAEWAKAYIVPGTPNISNAEGLGAAASGQNVVDTKTAEDGKVTFENLPVGAYVFIGSSANYVYSPVVVSTYDPEATYMAAKDINAMAKGSTEIITTKEADDTFVAKGEIVTFKVTTTFPNFVEMNPTEGVNSYEIIDTPVGLTITEVKSIIIGDTEVKADSAGYNDSDYVINLSSYIGDNEETFNRYVGASVTIIYEAQVTTDEGYSNTVHASRNNTTVGTTGTATGFTGSIELTKYATDSTTGLEGATFIVYKTIIADNGTEEKLVYATFDADNEFAGWVDAEDQATRVKTDANGIVKVTGLDEGEYTLEETVAPDGYSLNSGNAGKKFVVITAGEEDVNLTKDDADLIMYNTRLSELPSTGGIGTTIFTVVGCLIMIAAAAMFFVSRRKAEK